MGDNLVAKIADFGLSRGEEVYVKKTMVCGGELMKTMGKATNRPGTAQKRTVLGHCCFMSFMYMVALYQAAKDMTITSGAMSNSHMKRGVMAVRIGVEAMYRF